MSAARNSSPSSCKRDEFKCSVCWEFACEPLSLKPCDHFICKQCFQGLRESNSSHKCPFCRGSIRKSVPFVEMESKMAQLEENCPGCQHVFALRNMKHHVMKCPTLVHLEKYSVGINKRLIRLWKLPRRNDYYTRPRSQGHQWRETHNEQENSQEVSSVESTSVQHQGNDEVNDRPSEEVSPAQSTSVQHQGNDEVNDRPSEEVSTVQSTTVQHQGNDEVNDRPSSQDYQSLRNFQRQIPDSSFRADNGRENGSWERNGRFGPQIFAQSHWSSMRQKYRHAWAPASSTASYKEALMRNSSVGAVSGASSALENASPAIRMSTGKKCNFPPWDRRAQFECPSCKQFPNEPLCLKSCGHFICKLCLQSLEESMYPTYCPVCERGLAKFGPYREMELRMASWKEKCPGCYDMFPLSVMKQHATYCPILVLLEKYFDDETEIPKRANEKTRRASFDPSQGARSKGQPNTKRSRCKKDCDRNSSRTTVSVAGSLSENSSVARSHERDQPRYKCPYCGEAASSQLILVSHCFGQHAYEKRRVVCPICSSSRWGNPNKMSANFILHLRTKHALDAKTDVAVEEDEEEAMVAKALDASLRDF